jgi:hypothetical protein
VKINKKKKKERKKERNKQTKNKNRKQHEKASIPRIMSEFSRDVEAFSRTEGGPL